MGGGCGVDPWKAWENQATLDAGPTVPCCPSGQRYQCSINVTLPCPPPGTCINKPYCWEHLDDCFPSEAAATAAAQNFAINATPPGSKVASVFCQNFACDKPRRRHDEPGPFQPLDAPLCETLLADAGPSCLSNDATCTYDSDCCSGMCSEQGACETCRMTLEGCVADAECCSGVCSINACA
jgi:hypothetical protein